MLIFFLIIIWLLWMIFWSFASVLISRFYTKEWWIMTWRSHCINCKHELWALDLVPIFSYIFMLWKCRYCKKKISPEYPLLELVMWLFFVLVGIFLVDYKEIFLANTTEILRLVFFLFTAFVVVTFSVYDIKHQLIPTEILGPSIVIVLLILIISTFNIDAYNFFSYYIQFDNEFLNKPIFNALIWSLTIYTFFYLQIFLFWVFFALKNKKYTIILEQLIEYFIFPFYMIATVFKKPEETWKTEETEEEIETWMWHWDLWIAIFMWLVWGFKIAILWLAIAYFVWSIIWSYFLIRWERNKKIAFGPFLWLGLMLSLFFYERILTYTITILWLRL